MEEARDDSAELVFFDTFSHDSTSVSAVSPPSSPVCVWLCVCVVCASAVCDAVCVAVCVAVCALDAM